MSISSVYMDRRWKIYVLYSHRQAGFIVAVISYDICDAYLTAIGLTPGGSSTVHIDTQTVHRIQRTEHT
jgi:hypothetical protein